MNNFRVTFWDSYSKTTRIREISHIFGDMRKTLATEFGGQKSAYVIINVEEI